VAELVNPCRKPLLSQLPLVQAKLVVGQPNDRYEQEADRVADLVMGMPEPSSEYRGGTDLMGGGAFRPVSDQITPLVQRDTDDLVDEEKEEKRIAQPKPLPAKALNDENDEDKEEVTLRKPASAQTSQITPALEVQIDALRGSGRPLDPATRAFMEPRFGYDFSQVRVHTSSRVAETAQMLNARAFTTGKDIVFGAGEYAPKTSEGQLLLAHELVHVIQQAQKGLRIEVQKHPALRMAQLRGLVDLYYENWYRLGDDEMLAVENKIIVSLEHYSPQGAKQVYVRSKASDMLDRGFKVRKAFRARIRGRSVKLFASKRGHGIAKEEDIHEANDLVKKYYDQCWRICSTMYDNWQDRIFIVDKLISLPSTSPEEICFVLLTVFAPIGLRRAIENIKRESRAFVILGEAVKDSLRTAMRRGNPKAKESLESLEMPFTVAVTDWKLKVFNALATRAERERKAMSKVIEVLALMPEHAIPGSLQDRMRKCLGPSPKIPDYNAESTKVEKILWQRYLSSECFIEVVPGYSECIRVKGIFKYQLSTEVKQRVEKLFGRDVLSVARYAGVEERLAPAYR
jgi:hypothetical protein